MVAGCLAGGIYFMGDSLYPGRPSNPRGFFEDPEINGINEALLAQVLPRRPRFLGKWFFVSRPVEGQRWLAEVSLGTNIPCPQDLGRKIQELTSREPFCFKDPRFSYTLSVWRPLLNNTVFVCVFRDAASTALSILKECRDASYLHSLSMNFERALRIWTLMYKHILEHHRQEGEWLFLHYDDLFSGRGLSRLEAFLKVPVDRTFPDVSLHRSFSNHPVPAETRRVYEELCSIAGMQDRS